MKIRNPIRSWRIVLALAAVALVTAIFTGCAGQVAGTTSPDQDTPANQAQSNPMVQLAAGTLALQETDQAITAAQAAELVTLWKAYASLSKADGVAEAELEAVQDQITAALSEAQLDAIQATEINAGSLQALMGFTASDQDGEPGTGTGEGQGMGMGMGGGPGAGDVTQLTEEQIAERRAEREASGASPLVLNLIAQVVDMLESLA